MGFAAGSKVRAHPLSAAFTMVEVLLVIGMLVLIMGVAGLWVQRRLFVTEKRPPQEAFLAAAAQARVLAMQQGRTVLLTFDETAQGFRLKLLDADTPGGQRAYGGSLPWEVDAQRDGFSASGWTTAGNRIATGSAAGSVGNRGGGNGGFPADNSGGGGNGGFSAGNGGGVGNGGGKGGGKSDSVMRRVADARFFALPQGSRLRVTFYLMYGDEAVSLPQPLEGIRYHPSGISTPVQVRMEDRGATDFRLTLLPDTLSAGLRLDEGGQQ